MLPRQARDKYEENSKKIGGFCRRCGGRRSGLSLSASGRRYFFHTHSLQISQHISFANVDSIRSESCAEFCQDKLRTGTMEKRTSVLPAFIANRGRSRTIASSHAWRRRSWYTTAKQHTKTAPFSRSMMAVGSIVLCIHKDFTKTGSPEPTQTVQMRTDLSFCHVHHHRQENSVLPFRADPYGCKVGGVLSEKRAARDPTRRCVSFCDAVLY